jgi:hypothetical protein
MTTVAILLAPLLLLLPGGGSDAVTLGDAAGAAASNEPPARLEARDTTTDTTSQPEGYAVFLSIAGSFRQETANQVRIERQTTIRIAPRAAPPPASLYLDLPQRAIGPRFLERKIGNCLPASGIAGVQVDGANRLFLFMRDRRIVSASLERSCRARDYYSGFYVVQTPDGQVCVDRDTLLSRNGSNCKLTRIRQMIEIED